jgi:thymidylate kinase
MSAEVLSATEAGARLQRAAIAALDGAGIRWAVLRDDPMAAEAGDIDVLVHPADVGRLDVVLADVGFGRLVTWRHGDHRFFIAYDEVTDRWVKLDTVSRFAYRAGRELPTSAVGAVLARRVRVDDAWRLHPDDEFWALVLHCLLDRGTVDSRHLDRLRLLASETTPAGPLGQAVGQAGLAERVVDRARAADAAGLAALRHPIGAALPRPAMTRRLWLGARGTAAPALKALVRPGIGVAVMGPDGAGKSTLVRALPGTLPLQVRTYYGGLYGGRLRSVRSARVPGIALASQLGVTWSAYLSAAIQRRRGRITVFDRYGYDALLPSADGRPDMKRRVRRAILGRFIPRPDLVLVLDAPTDRLHGRKAEHERSEVARRRAAYRQLAERVDPRIDVEMIDTSGDPDAVRRRATLLIWQTFAGPQDARSGAPSQRGYNRAAMQGDEVSGDGNR